MQNKGFPSEWLSELKSKCEIVQTISSYIQVIKKGNSYWACCPFHHEKTPSFSINENGQYFHCFGCGEGGDVIKFVEKMEAITPGEAIKRLAEKVGMELPTLEDGAKIAQKKKDRDQVKEALNLAKEHYENNLYQPSAKLAQEYVKQRKFKKSDLDRFHIGYANGNEIIPYLESKGVSKDVMLKAGIIGEIDGKTYDHISNRLAFPILNSFGDCIGFSGRILEKSDYKAKYKNTAQTIVYDKSSSVYGIHLLKEAKTNGELNKIILVEGQIDVIMMHSFGFHTTVASLGTAFTEKHAIELKRFSDNLVLLFDGDGAGEKATLRAIDLLKTFNFNLKIGRLPEGSDPDEFLKENGADAMKKIIASAKTPIEYKLDLLKEKHDLQKTEDRTDYLKKALELVAPLQTLSEKEIYLKIISETANIPLDILRRDAKYTGEKLGAKEEKKVLITAEDGNSKAIKFVLASILKEKIFSKIDLDIKKYFVNPLYTTLLTDFEEEKKEQNNKSNSIILNDLFNKLEGEEKQLMAEICNANYPLDSKEYFDECVWKIVEADLKMRQQILNEEYKRADTYEERSKIRTELNEIVKKLANKTV